MNKTLTFEKYHALGNDYLVLDPELTESRVLEPCWIERVCHRNFGLGSDGILYGPLSSEAADFGLRILNPDGSEAEKSGNGLRIFARYLYDTGRVKSGTFTVDTPGGTVVCQVIDPLGEIQVEMGQIRFLDKSGIKLGLVDSLALSRENLARELTVEEQNYTYYAADIGNPHCVVPMDSLSKEEICRYGGGIENHADFPNRTNVQFLRVIDRNTIQIEIWERGAGYTLASGSSSSAAAAVAHLIGACEASLTVRMPGGDLRIEIEPDGTIHMAGPATRVARMHLEPEAVAALPGSE